MELNPGDAVLVHDPALPVMAATVLDVFEANQSVRVKWVRPGCEGVYYASFDHVTRYDSLEAAQQEVQKRAALLVILYARACEGHDVCYDCGRRIPDTPWSGGTCGCSAQVDEAANAGRKVLRLILFGGELDDIKATARVAVRLARKQMSCAICFEEIEGDDAPAVDYYGKLICQICSRAIVEAREKAADRARAKEAAICE